LNIENTITFKGKKYKLKEGTPTTYIDNLNNGTIINDVAKQKYLQTYFDLVPDPTVDVNTENV
jgi:hypothetical protein